MGIITISYSTQLIAANNPFIQYYNRWDLTDSLHPRHSWPAVYICAEFSGTSVGIRMIDSINAVFTVSGLLLENGANLFPPPVKLKKELMKEILFFIQEKIRLQ